MKTRTTPMQHAVAGVLAAITAAGNATRVSSKRPPAPAPTSRPDQAEGEASTPPHAACTRPRQTLR
jgi:hypothetical protein